LRPVSIQRGEISAKPAKIKKKRLEQQKRRAKCSMIWSERALHNQRKEATKGQQTPRASHAALLLYFCAFEICFLVVIVKRRQACLVVLSSVLVRANLCTLPSFVAWKMAKLVLEIKMLGLDSTTNEANLLPGPGDDAIIGI